MNAVATAIMNAAEQHLRLGGFSGFSFRDLAAEVGIKSSSVHYHFPTKEKLAAAVVRRYGLEISGLIDRECAAGGDPVTVWTRTFRHTLDNGRMCPCTILGAASLDLPSEVAEEVARFYQMCLSKLESQGLSSRQAIELLSSITGALVLENALRDGTVFDHATGGSPDN
jgi:TetR/AcrR family transcriptional regulator, transcriptional repressor for nem operon